MGNNDVNIRNCHLIAGGLGLILFALQGQYMARVLGVELLPDASRMMYRSAHIYFLLVCAANIGIGYTLPAGGTVNVPQRVISVIFLIAPLPLLYSFFTESTDAALERPVASITLYLIFAAAVLMVLHELYRRFQARANRNGSGRP